MLTQIKRHFERNKNEIIKKIDLLLKKQPNAKEYKAGIYGMRCTIDYSYLKKEINKAYKELI